MAWYGVRRKSLDILGGVAAILVGFVLTVGSGCFCVSLLVFFYPADSVEGEGEGEVRGRAQGRCVCVCVCVHIDLILWEFNKPSRPSIQLLLLAVSELGGNAHHVQ